MHKITIACYALLLSIALRLYTLPTYPACHDNLHSYNQSQPAL